MCEATSESNIFEEKFHWYFFHCILHLDWWSGRKKTFFPFLLWNLRPPPSSASPNNVIDERINSELSNALHDYRLYLMSYALRWICRNHYSFHSSRAPGKFISHIQVYQLIHIKISIFLFLFFVAPLLKQQTISVYFSLPFLQIFFFRVCFLLHTIVSTQRRSKRVFFIFVHSFISFKKTFVFCLISAVKVQFYFVKYFPFFFIFSDLSSLAKCLGCSIHICYTEMEFYSVLLRLAAATISVMLFHCVNALLLYVLVLCKCVI